MFVGIRSFWLAHSKRPFNPGRWVCVRLVARLGCSEQPGGRDPARGAIFGCTAMLAAPTHVVG